ncbi:MAG: UvrD-helicase domain-containing protein, partial [Bacteroidota bacterium]
MGLTVYKASAGSGKTYTLAVEYIAVLLRHPEAYNNILAATFTNKAAAELKSRVIKVLSLLSSGDHAEGYFTTLKDKTQMSDHDITRNAGIALKKILHDYSRFSVSTIDRFFNRILSSFMYEVNIRPDSEISLDDVVNREEALDELLINFDVSTPLGRWLMAYAKSKIEDEKNWNIRWELSNESKAITSETFLAREQMLGNLSQDKGKLEKYRDKIYGIIKKHEAEAQQTGKKARELIDGSAFSISDFSNTMNGPAGFLLRLQKEGFKKGITKRAAEATDDPLKFLTQSNQSRADLRQFVEEKLHPLLQHIVTYIENNEKDFYTAVAIASNINSFGVLLDINHELRKICSERQIYFPFQMAQLLHDIVSLDNALWVYEKIGTQYKHYLLDEFQDTSRMQWDILKPLLEESLGSGGETLIVGDVKQSIYRWRNGDWNMLSHEVEQQFPHGNQKSLKYNYRSRRDIVRFNNHLMDALIPVFQQHIDSKLNNDNQPEFDLTALYDQYIQTPNKTNSPFGHVKIRFPDGDGDNDENWKEKAMDEMVQEMTTLMDKGYSPGDMAVLVNKNTEAGQIAMRIMEEDKNSGYGFPVVSAASLLLKENNLVQVILSALAWIDQPDNHIALTQLVYTYQTEVLQNKDYKPRPEQSGDKAVADAMKQDLPTAFVSLKNKLAGWPLYDLTENIIQWFDLHKHQEAYAYLNAFQDQILQYSQNNPVEIASFLQWFDKKGPKLEMPDSAGSIVVSTVHKAKGLEFRFVFMPFTDWRLKTPGKTPRLWVEPEHSPFDEIPLVMVNASSDLEKSHFVDEYKEEEFNQHVDMLNKFYVAVTRAEEGLYIWAPPAKG